MHGNPLFRVLVLAAFMVVTGLIVAAVARAPKSAGLPGPTAPPPAREDAVSTVLTIQLSAPARSLSLRSADGGTDPIPPHQPDALDSEHRIAFVIPNGTLTALLSIEWESPSPNRFVRLVLEPEHLESRELVLHAPDHLNLHAISFQWPNHQEASR